MPNERRIVELVLKAVGDPELKRMTRDLVAMRKAADESQRSLSSIQSGLAGLAKLAAGVVSVAALVGTLRSLVEIGGKAIAEMDELSVTISKVGVAAEDFQKLQFAATLSNVSLEALNKGLVKLSVAIADVGGKNSAATKALRELGISAGAGTLDAMKALADQFEKMPDGAQKTALAVQYFGKAGAELIPLLNEGSKGLGDMFAEAEKLGLILSNEALAGANAFGDEMDRLGAVIDADTKKLMGGMAPALVTVAQLLTGAAANSMDFESAGAALGAVIVAVAADVVRFGKTLQAYGKSAVLFIQSMGQALQGWDAFLSGNVGAADSYMRAAKLNLEASTLYWNNAEAIGNAAARRVQTQYQQNIAAIKAEAAKLGQGGGAGDPEGTAAGGGGGRGARAGAANDNSALSATNQAKLHAAAIRDVAAAINEQREAREKSTEALAAQVAELERAAHPGIAYAEELDRINKLQREGGLSAEAYALAIQKNEEALRSANQALVANSAAQREHDEQQERNRQQLEKAREEWGFLADAMGRATYDIITGAEKTGQAVKRMVATIISEFIRLAAIKLAEKFLSGPFPGFSLHAKGDAFGASGIVHRPTMFAYGGGIGIAGEAGPEAIMPLQRNAQGQLGVVANGGGLQVVVNNNVPNAAVQVRETDRGLQIDLIERQLADRVRRGGSALPGALENTYRTGRQASAY